MTTASLDTATSVQPSLPLSVSQAAARAGISTKTIRRWLSSHRLDATRGPDGAWLIDPDALARAIATPGLSMDSPARHRGQGQDVAIVQEVLGRLERQAERIGFLESELAQVQAQLLALQAPRAISSGALGRDAAAADGTAQPLAEPNRPWWRFW